MLDEKSYLDHPNDWTELAVVLRVAGVVGLDTEFYGVDLSEQHPHRRSRVHVWSVAVRTTRRSPLGFHRARGWCLPAAALDHPGLRRVLEDRLIVKAVHNQGVDDHALFNHGLQLRGAVNTLAYLRWKRPELVGQPGRFALKPCMQVLLHREPIASFADVVGWEGTEEYFTERREVRSVCECGVAGCRKRKGHEKTKIEELVRTPRTRKIAGEFPLESIVPGHERWDLLVRYAIDDAIAALEILELCEGTGDPAPFPYGAQRPEYRQDIEDEIVVMERVGLPIDTAYADERLQEAWEDEITELAWLERWFLTNCSDYEDADEIPGELFETEAINAIWSSPQQKIALFDWLGFPASPIWGKGKVKRGEVKMDQTALGWIARNHPPAKQLCEHLVKLQRVRSGKKYLEKLAASGGMVHPTCGPSGDDDGRAGAVTGRLGVKVELEAQQLPKQKAKDLYKIRKAIVAECPTAVTAVSEAVSTPTAAATP